MLGSYWLKGKPGPPSLIEVSPDAKFVLKEDDPFVTKVVKHILPVRYASILKTLRARADEMIEKRIKGMDGITKEEGDSNIVLEFLRLLWKHELKHDRFTEMESRSTIMDVFTSVIPLETTNDDYEKEISFRISHHSYWYSKQTMIAVQGNVKERVGQLLEGMEEKEKETVQNCLKSFCNRSINDLFPLLIAAVNYVEWVIDRDNKLLEFISRYWRYSFGIFSFCLLIIFIDYFTYRDHKI